MYKFLNNLAYRITKENWGFPWHIILAMILTRILFYVFAQWVPDYYPQNYGVVWLLVNAAGYINEVIEKRKGNNPRRDMWQDMLANNIGFLLGL